MTIITNKEIADNRLKVIALRVFGTRDGITPLFPKSGGLIQEAMKQAYELGKREASPQTRTG